MKILHILYSGLGGHGNVFFSMVTADKDKEFEYEALFNGIENVRNEYIQKCKASNINWNFIKKERPGFSLNFYKQFSNHIKQSNADIVFLHSSSYILPAIMANELAKNKKRIIVRETQANNLKTKPNWFWLIISFFFADKIVFLSEEYKMKIKRKLTSFYKEHKVIVIPNGIDLEVYKPGHQTKQNPIVIGMQSRLTDNKDHETLIKAFALLKKNNDNIKLVIAGDGPCKDKLVTLADTLNISSIVEFTGMLEEPELIKFLQSIQIYVHASHGETMSTAIMQAMACGLPCIASDVEGINNMIKDKKTGLLVPVKNVEKLAQAIIECINNCDFTHHLAKNSFLYAQENLSHNRMIEQYKREVFYN